MSEHSPRYPAATPLRIDAFRQSELERIACEIEPTYSALSGALSDLARVASEKEAFEEARVWWLLGDLCSMMLDVTNHNEPFRPYLVMGNRHSMVPATLANEEFEFFRDVVDELPDGLLKARVSDLLWITPGRRHIRHALAAIDGYTSVPINDEYWHQEGRECLHRALTLAKQIRAGGGDRLSVITAMIMDATRRAIEEKLVFSVGLAQTVMEFGLDHPDALELPEMMAELGRSFDESKDIFKARACYETASRGYALSDRAVLAAKMTVAAAETWVSEAELRGEQTHPVVAQNALENALQVYRSLPGALRIELQVEEVLPILRRKIAEAGARAVEQMATVVTRTDITEVVARTRDLIQGQTIGNAVYRLTTLFPFRSMAQAREAALGSLRAGIVSSLTGTVFYDGSGRVIARRPPLSFGAEPSESDEHTIQAQMVSEHQHIIKLTVRSGVLPALAIISQEHCIKEIDMVELAKASSLVPPSRSQMIGKGLYWGFAGDFGMAAHFLIPQLEAMIRHQMKEAGLNTSTSNADGIVTENGLSTLMDVEGVTELLGENVAFEIKAVFCSPYGPNLRNTFAHGLMDDGQFYSESTVYAWWFFLKYISGPFWETVRNR